jgi:hypothetical protein
MLHVLIQSCQDSTGDLAEVSTAFTQFAGFNQCGDTALVTLQQVGINLFEFDQLQFVGNAPFQKLAVVGRGVPVKQAFSQGADLAHFYHQQSGDLGRYRGGRGVLSGSGFLGGLGFHLDSSEWLESP